MCNRLAALFAAVLGLTSSQAVLGQAPVPVREGFVTEGFVDWDKTTSDLPAGVKYLHRPRAVALGGSALWFLEYPGQDRRAAFLAAAERMGITAIRIEASQRMQKATMLDQGGAGEVFIASGSRSAKPFRMAAIVVYGSLDDSPRSSGVHMFAAPADLYATMGGWTVPASLFLGLDPQNEVTSIAEQGAASPAIQAERLAGIADIWAQWVLDTYIRMAQSNMQALSNFRKSVVCAGDPHCVIVYEN